MAIWATGDIHGNARRFFMEAFPEQKEMTKEDVMLQLGDFGLIWDWRGDTNEEEYWLDLLEEKNFTLCFVDGNHENHDRLSQYPVKEWHGGKVHEIRPHVLHLMRGEIFDICGKKVFAFGGASSHDISDGIIDPADYPNEKALRRELQRMELEGKYMYRIKGRSWWEQELPTEEEMQNGLKNLEKHNYKVDYIITHCPPASTIALLGQGLYKQDVLTKYLEEVRQKTNYKYWLFGHMHISKAINDKDICLYEQIVRIN